MIRLAIRTLPVFAVIIGLAMALAAYLNFSGVRTAYLDLIRARAGMIAADVADDIAMAQSLGIRLSEQRMLPDLLARQAASDPLILSVDVAGPDGRVLFSSDPARLGALAAQPETGVFRHAQTATGAFGAPVGEVDLRLDGAAMAATLSGLRRDLLGGALPAGLFAVAAGCLMSLWLLSRLRARARRAAEAGEGDPIARVERELEAMAREKAGTEPQGPPPSSPSSSSPPGSAPA